MCHLCLLSIAQPHDMQKKLSKKNDKSESFLVSLVVRLLPINFVVFCERNATAMARARRQFSCKIILPSF